LQTAHSRETKGGGGHWWHKCNKPKNSKSCDKKRMIGFLQPSIAHFFCKHKTSFDPALHFFGFWAKGLGKGLEVGNETVLLDDCRQWLELVNWVDSIRKYIVEMSGIDVVLECTVMN